MKNKFTVEQEFFINKNVKGKTVEELTKIFNLRFGTNFSENQIRNYKKKNKLKSGVNTRFVKKQRAHNYKPIGSEFINSDGYTEIKVSDPNKWVLKQRYIYEKYKGKIPEKYDVIFADKNKQNFDLDNLVLVERRDKLIMKNKHLFYENKEATECGILIARIISKTFDKRRNR